MIRFFKVTMVILAAVVCVSCSEEKQAVDSDLAGYWKFDVLTENNEMTPDVSGNGHHGRVHGQKLVDGIIGGALNFEGYDQIVEVGDLSLRAPATVAFWVRTNDVFRDRRLFSQMEGSDNQAGALRFDCTQVEVWDGENWQVLIDRKVRIDTWLHIAVVFEENGKTSGYLNGERQHLIRSGFDFSGVKAAIGGKFLCKTGNLFTGEMDDFRIYGKALGKEEVISLFSER